jgi:hypothetical protein
LTSLNHPIFSSRFVTIQQHFFTTVRVWWRRGEFVHFPPQRGRSAIGGRGDDKRKVCVSISMGRIFSGNARYRGSSGERPAAAAVSLFAKGVSGRKSTPSVVLQIYSFQSFSLRRHEASSSTDGSDTGLVTFAVYEDDKGGRVRTRIARRVPQASQVGRAGSRMVHKGVLVLKEGHGAGSDAGKGALEPAAGSLAWKECIHAGRTAKKAAARRL